MTMEQNLAKLKEDYSKALSTYYDAKKAYRQLENEIKDNLKADIYDIFYNDGKLMVNVSLSKECLTPNFYEDLFRIYIQDGDFSKAVMQSALLNILPYYDYKVSTMPEESITDFLKSQGVKMEDLTDD